MPGETTPPKIAREIKRLYRKIAPNVILISRLSAKGTDGVMKHGAASAMFLLLLYLFCRAGTLQNPGR